MLAPNNNRGVTHQTDEKLLNKLVKYFVGVVNIAFNHYITIIFYNVSLTNNHLKYLSVPQSPNLMNSARLHKVFQNFVVPWKIHIYKNLILSSDASRQDASNGIRVAYVNFYHKWVLRQG